MASTTKFDLKSEATRGLYAGAGVADLAIGAVKEYVAEDVQKRLNGAQELVEKRVEAAQKTVYGLDAAEAALAGGHRREHPRRGPHRGGPCPSCGDRGPRRRAAGRGEASQGPAAVDENVATASKTYSELAKRGENAVKRVRKETSSAVDPGPVKKTTGTTVETPPPRRRRPGGPAPRRPRPRRPPPSDLLSPAQPTRGPPQIWWGPRGCLRVFVPA